MSNNRIARKIKNHLGIAVGALFLALSYSWFLIPYKIAPGGVGGLAQIFYHFFDIPTGVSMIIINIPLFVLGFFMLGKIFGIRSFYGMLISSILTDLTSFPNLLKLGIIKDLSPYTYQLNGETIYAMLSPDDIYLSAIAGSVLLGFGLGIIFRFKGSTGGTDIPVAIIKQKTGMSLGTGYWIVETLIILTIGLVFKDLKLVIWGYVNLFISSKITDITSEGLPYVKGVYIISDKYAEIRDGIFEHLRRGVTFINSTGAYTEKAQKMIFCVISRRQVAVIRDIVKDIDPQAFMILSDVHDVMGLGFKSRNIDLTDNSED